MWLRNCWVLLLVWAMANTASAAGAAVFATIDRSSWPGSLASEVGFDEASRAEILMFSNALLGSETQDEAALKQRLGLKHIDLASIERVRQQFWQRLLGNYQRASQHCNAQAMCKHAVSLEDLRKLAAASGSDPLEGKPTPWALASRRFHEHYLTEQLRLAALFPRVSSEVERFDRAELTGEELADRTFLLTFDDGPTGAGKHTDAVATLLRANDLHGVFFVLGEAFQTRLQKSSPEKMQTLYQGQCVGLHGWEHKSHAAWSEWQPSITRSAALVSGALGAAYQPLFRPPYG